MALVLALGTILRKKKVIDDRGQLTLTNLLLNAVLPFSILSSSQYQYSSSLMRSIIAVAAGAAIYYLVTLVALRLILWRTKMDDRERRVFVSTSIFANTGFVGMPIMYSLFGDAGMLLAAIYNLVYNVFFYTYGVHLISGRKPSIKEYVNPVSIASVLAVILFMIPWRAPVFISDTLQLVGNMTFPLSMIIMGSTLATVDIKKLFSDSKSYLVCLLRLIVFPLLMIGVLTLIGKYTTILPATLIALTLMTALPSGTMSVIYSERYDCAPKFCARTVALTLVFMVITLPVMIALCAKFFYGV